MIIPFIGTFLTEDLGKSSGVDSCDSRNIMLGQEMLNGVNASEIAWNTG